MTAPKGSGTGMKQIWKTIMMMVSFAILVAMGVGGYYKSKADTTSQITTVNDSVTKVEIKQEYIVDKLTDVTKELEEEVKRSRTAKQQFSKQIEDINDSLMVFKINTSNKLDRILEKLE